MRRVVRVLAPNPGTFTLEGTNTWIVGRDPAVVIDPGPDDPGHVREVIREAGRIGVILITHDHPDHAPAASALAAATGATVFAHLPREGGERIRDRQEFRPGDIALRAVSTPGHTADHVSFFAEEERALFAGDAVLGRGTSVIDPPEGDLAAFLRSLRRMRDLRPRTIYPGHGSVVTDAIGKLDEYLDHRALREAQVLTALSDGPRAPRDIAAKIYLDYEPELLRLGIRSVLAHLIKLEAEGRVARVGKASEERYELLDPRACERCGRPVRGRARLCSRCSLAELQEQPEG